MIPSSIETNAHLQDVLANDQVVLLILHTHRHCALDHCMLLKELSVFNLYPAAKMSVAVTKILLLSRTVYIPRTAPDMLTHSGDHLLICHLR